MRMAAEELSRENEMMEQEISNMRERQRDMQSQDASTRHFKRDRTKFGATPINEVIELESHRGKGDRHRLTRRRDAETEHGTEHHSTATEHTRSTGLARTASHITCAGVQFLPNRSSWGHRLWPLGRGPAWVGVTPEQFCQDHCRCSAQTSWTMDCWAHTPIAQEWPMLAVCESQCLCWVFPRPPPVTSSVPPGNLGLGRPLRPEH